MVKIGILNLQGAVSEHFDMTRKTVEKVLIKLLKKIIFLSLELVLEWCFLAKKQISTSRYLNLWT